MPVRSMAPASPRTIGERVVRQPRAAVGSHRGRGKSDIASRWQSTDSAGRIGHADIRPTNDLTGQIMPSFTLATFRERLAALPAEGPRAAVDRVDAILDGA